MIDYFATFTNTDLAAFPDTQAVNVSAPGAGDGTEFIAALVNDIWGRAQAMMNYAGLTPDGSAEADGTAQILDAISHGWGIGPGVGVMYWKNDTPAVHGDRVLLLQGQEIAQAAYPLLFAAVYCGDANNATAATFYSTDGAGGRLTPGGGGTHFVLPDTRGLSLKNIGDATISGRTKTGPTELGEVQEDQFQGHRFENGVYTQTSIALQKFGDFGASTNKNASASVSVAFDTGYTGSPLTDGVNGTPRTGTNTRDSSIGTNFGITY